MNNNLAELINQSESGNELAQITLFFKQFYDFDNIQAAALICDKWREHNLFLEGVWYFYGFWKFESTFKYNKQPTNFDKDASSEIFKKLIKRDDEIGYHSCNMLALCNKLSEREQVEYLNIAAKHGISYAHINLAMRADSVELQMYHYKLAALKHDKFAILELARIYLYKEHPVNWQLAIKCYQQAMNCEYDLGAICVLLILRDYDIGTTIHLLEYEINRKNNKAILALADIYATHNKVNNQTYAMDLYVSANNIDDVGERNIQRNNKNWEN